MVEGREATRIKRIIKFMIINTALSSLILIALTIYVTLTLIK